MFEEEDQEDSAGAAPVFTGLHRPKLTWPGIDGRVFALAIILALCGAISGVGARNLATVAIWLVIFFGGAVVVFATGIVLGRVAPYFVDDFSMYLTLRLERFSLNAPDDAGNVFRGLKLWR